MSEHPLQPLEPQADPPEISLHDDKQRSWWGAIGQQFASISSTIIVPYLLLTMAVAAVGIYIVTQLIAGKFEERFTNQLLESAGVASDAIVRLERNQLEVVNRMQGTIGVDQAILSRNNTQLQILLEVQAVSANVDSVMVLDTSGELILGLDAVRNQSDQYANPQHPYQASKGGNYASLPLVTPILEKVNDPRGTKYAGLVQLQSGMTVLFTSTPVYAQDPSNNTQNLVGVILVGTRLERTLVQIKSEALADMVVYTSPGEPIGSTLPNWAQEPQFGALSITQELYNEGLQTPTSTPLREFQQVELFKRDYRVAYAPMVVRGINIGVIGVMLPSAFVETSISTNRDLIVAIFSIGIVLTVVVGFLIARRIIQPVGELVEVSRTIAGGDLTRRSHLKSQNELGILSNSFNTMADRLESYTSELELENARTTAILESTADGVLVRDPGGQIVIANRAAKAILSSDGVFDPMRLNAFSIPRDQGDLAHRIELGPRTISISMASVNLPDGTYIGDVLVLRDITREAIAERTKENFLNQITHELRTPLTAIKGFADVLRMGGDKLKPDFRERAVETIFRSTYVLSHMIDQIVDLTAMQSGSMVLYAERIDLRQLLDEILEEWKEKFQEFRLTPTLVFPAGKLVINVDHRRLRRAIEAVLQNSCDFSPEGGPLKLTVRKSKTGVSIVISDSGVGISPEDMAHMFERFYRGTPYDRHGNLIDVRGMGQGLYVVKSIVEAHGGTVVMDSALGKGTTVEIDLPLAPTKASA